MLHDARFGSENYQVHIGEIMLWLMLNLVAGICQEANSKSKFFDEVGFLLTKGA